MMWLRHPAAPALEDPDAGQFADGSRVRIGLVDADATEAGLLAGLLVDRDDVVTGAKRRLVEPHRLDVIQQPDLLPVFRVPNVHGPT